MDKTARTLLSFGIAVLFPILVYFVVVTVLPTKANLPMPVYPEQPYCPTSTTYNDNYSNCSYAKQYQYQQDSAAYENVRAKNARIDKDNDRRNLYRAEIALLSAVATMALAAIFRESKELSAGLVIGGAITVVAAVSVIMGIFESSDQHTNMVASLAVTGGFVGLSVLLKFLDKLLPEEPQPESKTEESPTTSK